MIIAGVWTGISVNVVNGQCFFFFEKIERVDQINDSLAVNVLNSS